MKQTTKADNILDAVFAGTIRVIYACTNISTTQFWPYKEISARFGHMLEFPNKDVVFLFLKIVIVKANRKDPAEMIHFVAFICVFTVYQSSIYGFPR